MTTVILAGGLGTRLAKLQPDTPKALTRVLGKPVLTWQIEQLRRYGLTDILLLCGHKAQQIMDYYADGSAYGVRIQYRLEEQPLGTGGGLPQLHLQEDFFLLNGDLIFDVDLSAMLSYHRKKHALATLFSHPSAHPADSMRLQTDPENRITAMCFPGEQNDAVHNLCNAGISILSPALLPRCTSPRKMDLDREILKPGIQTNRVFAYRSSEYIKDMGTPERLRSVENDLRQNIPAQRRKGSARAAVFLDRDGTINRHKGYISDPQALELIPGAADAIRKIHKAGYLAVLITNQPVVARGECSLEELDKIHCRLEALLGAESAYLDGIYVCPHHPDAGYPGENRKYKVVCSCRKPKPGLILSAAKEMQIDLKRSFMVGDSLTDVRTAENAGCRPVLLSDEIRPDGIPVFQDLSAFAQSLD